MNVLIVGGGGREHALAWRVAQSPQAEAVYVSPGNAGTALEPRLTNVPIDADDLDALVAFAREKAVGLTIVGPEAPLVIGIVDRFREAGLRVFGPTAAAAELEGSKTYSKDFLARHKIPTAAYASFTEVGPALAYLKNQRFPVVIKADGLAAGKGVVIAESPAVASDTVRDMLDGGAFGAAGQRVVIEEFLRGEEASFIVMVDGEHVLAMASSQDHKARDDGDRGPNTGGMGAYSPAPVVTAEMHDRVMREVMLPTVAGMAAEGRPYTGFLYAGLMIDAAGVPKVLEFNCRFGDPETQPIMMRLKSDLIELCVAATEGRLDQVEARWDSRAALGVVMAAGGYPGRYRSGAPITGLDEAESPGVKVFHAGTRLDNGQVLTAGGRVLCVTALGERILDARVAAYERVATIRWDEVYYRTDIGHRAVGRDLDSDSS
ncbi:MAG: phosphoribosylamine--glycine ligase [Chromatiales bacterium]|nr:phosphoribosylamine--glycine ligase [Chromatiales bacterium]